MIPSVPKVLGFLSLTVCPTPMGRKKLPSGACHVVDVVVHDDDDVDDNDRIALIHLLDRFFTVFRCTMTTFSRLLEVCVW